MEHLQGRGHTGPFTALVAVVAVLALLGAVKLSTEGGARETIAARSGATGTPPPPESPPAAGEVRAVPAGPATSVRLPTGDCTGAGALRLHDLSVTPHAASQPADSLSDLEITACGARSDVLVTPDGDALLSSAGIAGDADYTACAESMRQGTVSGLQVGVGATFCALQRAGTIPRLGRQTMARVTVTGIDPTGTVTMDVVRWLA